MRGNYGTVRDAIIRYPALKQTVERAKEFNVAIIGHFAQLTKKGKVCCHWWLVLDKKTDERKYQRNQELLMQLKVWKEFQKRPVLSAHQTGILNKLIEKNETITVDVPKGLGKTNI